MLKFFKNIWNRYFAKMEPEDLRDTIEELIEETPSIEQDERVLLGNVLNLRDLVAKDVMVPRADIHAVPNTARVEDVLKFMVEHDLSIVPVYQTNLDSIIGMITSHEVLKWVSNGENAPLSSLMREPAFVSPNMRTLDLLLYMRETGNKIVIVVDEYGGVDGLVTLSSLIEAIIGDIQDARGGEGVLSVEQQQDGTLVADGRVTLEDLQDYLGTPLEDGEIPEDVETVGGLVTLIAGRVPVTGEIIVYDNRNIEFEVLAADPRRIHRLRIKQGKSA